MRNVAFKVDKATGCWNCTSHKVSSSGYPLANHNGKLTTLHRHIYIQHTGRQLPSHIEVMHKCDNKSCINPSHLHEGTHHQNMLEAADRDRVPFGIHNGMAKLNDFKAKEIARSNESLSVLATRFGVAYSTIWAIKNGKTWQRATGIGRDVRRH